MQIYVGNLSTKITDEELKAMFDPFGKVIAATIGRDKKTDESQGYGFIEMPVKSEARTAIEGLRGKELEGKPLRVKALKPGDTFHQHANTVHGNSKVGGGGMGPTKQIRQVGAIRRGGQRGS